MPRSALVLENETAVLAKLHQLIEEVANESIASRNNFFIGFSGGSLGKYLCQTLPKIKTDWSKWTIFFCDERYVEESDGESTYGFYKNNLLPLVPLTEQQFISINVNDSIEKVADDYERVVREKVSESEGVPAFDMLLMGVGPDGHTASLFPGHPLLKESSRFITFITDSPKPPPKRITMTYSLINNARYAVFTVPGKGKAEIIKNIFEDKVDFPAARVDSKKVIWLLDQDSASACSVKFETA